MLAVVKAPSSPEASQFSLGLNTFCLLTERAFAREFESFEYFLITAVFVRLEHIMLSALFTFDTLR